MTAQKHFFPWGRLMRLAWRLDAHAIPWGRRAPVPWRGGGAHARRQRHRDCELGAARASLPLLQAAGQGEVLCDIIAVNWFLSASAGELWTASGGGAGQLTCSTLSRVRTTGIWKGLHVGQGSTVHCSTSTECDTT